MLYLIAQVVIGLALILLGAAVWFARRYPKLKRWLEHKLLDPGEDLFAAGKPYSGHVLWLRYAAIPTGFAFMFPSNFVIDAIIALVGAILFWVLLLLVAIYRWFVRLDSKPQTD